MSAWAEGLLVLILTVSMILLVVGVRHWRQARNEKRPRANYKLPPWKDVTRPKR